jgi:hypothetical protein
MTHQRGQVLSGVSIGVILALILGLALAACSVRDGGTPGAPAASGASASASVPFGPDASAKPQEQWFAPPYETNPPAGRQQRLTDARLSADHRTITVTFVGSLGYLASNSCTADYAPWVGMRDGILLVDVVETVPFGRALPGNTPIPCTVEGYGYAFHVGLSEPFDGTTVEDGAGTTLWVAPPAGLAKLTVLPSGWSLQAGFDVPSASPSLYAQVYAAGPIPEPTDPASADAAPREGPGRLFAYQAFGAAVNASIGDPTAEEIPIEVHGATVTLYHRKQDGEYFLKFSVDGDGIALDANDRDFTPEALAVVANGISLPSSAPTPSAWTLPT